MIKTLKKSLKLSYAKKMECTKKKKTQMNIWKTIKFVTALYTDYGKVRIIKMRKAYIKKDGIVVDARA